MALSPRKAVPTAQRAKGPDPKSIVHLLGPTIGLRVHGHEVAAACGLSLLTR